MLPTTFTFSEPPSALQPNRLIKPSLFFDGSILYVTFADILSKLYIIKIAINDNINDFF